MPKAASSPLSPRLYSKGGSFFSLLSSTLPPPTLHPQPTNSSPTSPRSNNQEKGREMGTMEEKEKTHHRETHGRSSDVIESISIDKVKGPNVFERAKEEIEALVDTIRSNKNHDNDHDHDDHSHTKKVEKKVEAPNLHDKSKEESEVDIHIVKEKVHKRETHGKSNDIDENTPLNKIKGPNILQRAKEEIEAIAGTIHPRTEPDQQPQEETQENFWGFFARLFEKICSPYNAKRD